MLEAENCRLYAIAGRNLEKAQAFRQEFGFEKAYGSYEALLADPAVEAVYIPLPNELHYEWSIKAMKAGKHVLCEKPLAPTPVQIEQMQAAAKENGVVLMEAFAYLHSPLMAAMKAELEKGVIGDILYADSCFITSDYDISNIRMRKATFGGSVYDLGCYCTSQLLWLIGEEPASIQAVAQFSQEKIDILTTGILTFPSGAKASFQCGMLLATEENERIDRFQIHGTLGSICTDARFNQCGQLTYTVTAGGQTRTEVVSARQNYALEVEQLGRCIAEGEMPHVSWEFTLRNARTLDAILNTIGY